MASEARPDATSPRLPRFGPAPFLLTAAGLAAVGLTLGLILKSPQAGERDLPQRGAGIIVFDRCSEVWLPDGWPDLAQADDRHPFRTHDDLRRHLESTGRTGLWYLVTFRGTQADGDTVVARSIRTPYEQPAFLEEFRAILDAASRREPTDPAFDFSDAAFLDIPDDFKDATPAQALARLNSGPPAETP